MTQKLEIQNNLFIMKKNAVVETYSNLLLYQKFIHFISMQKIIPTYYFQNIILLSIFKEKIFISNILKLKTKLGMKISMFLINFWLKFSHRLINAKNETQIHQYETLKRSNHDHNKQKVRQKVIMIKIYPNSSFEYSIL